MAEPVIRSPRNPRVAAAASLHRRRERQRTGRTLLEGPHLLEDAVGSGIAITEVFALAGDRIAEQMAAAAGARFLPVSARVLSRVAGTAHPRGPVAVVEVPEPDPWTSDHLILPWGVGDPGNAGTIIRTAAAFGMGIVAVGDTVDVWSPKVLRAAAGAHFRTPVTQVQGLAVADVQTRGFVVVASQAAGGRSPAGASAELSPGRRIAVLVGDEAHGLPDTVIEEADLRVTIAMPGGTESLNAAVAAAILAYEFVGRPASPD